MSGRHTILKAASAAVAALVPISAIRAEEAHISVDEALTNAVGKWLRVLDTNDTYGVRWGAAQFYDPFERMTGDLRVACQRVLQPLYVKLSEGWPDVADGEFVRRVNSKHHAVSRLYYTCPDGQRSVILDIAKRELPWTGEVLAGFDTNTISRVEAFFNRPFRIWSGPLPQPPGAAATAYDRCKELLSFRKGLLGYAAKDIRKHLQTLPEAERETFRTNFVSEAGLSEAEARQLFGD